MTDNIKKFAVLAVAFLAAYFMPTDSPRVQGALNESIAMLHEYARQHVLLCLVPAFFIAGAISVFVSQASVMKYFGLKANKPLSYSVASVSGTILAVCSCTVLPLFMGIYLRGAGLGPAIAFLYSGPAINVLAIVLTARVLGFQMGLARAIGAVGFAFVAGLAMHAIFIKGERLKAAQADEFDVGEVGEGRPLWKTAIYFAVMVAILVFANWSKPTGGGLAAWEAIYRTKWTITGALLAALALILIRWFSKEELKEWCSVTWTFGLQIVPLLFAGVLVAGFLLGRPGHEGLIRSEWVAGLVGGNSLFANFFASISGAFMYFATLTEVPILQGLIGSGMGKGPSLSLLLAGPALSLPSMLVLGMLIGFKKTLAYASIVVVLATGIGKVYGTWF